MINKNIIQKINAPHLELWTKNLFNWKTLTEISNIVGPLYGEGLTINSCLRELYRGNWYKGGKIKR